MNQVDIRKLVADIEEVFPVDPILQEDDDWLAGYKDGKETMRDFIIGFLEEYLK